MSSSPLFRAMESGNVVTFLSGFHRCGNGMAGGSRNKIKQQLLSRFHETMEVVGIEFGHGDAVRLQIGGELAYRPRKP